MAMSMLFGRSEATKSMPAAAGMLLFLGPALGPSVGGALITAAGWRFIFLINVPTGLAAVLSVRRIPAEIAAGRADEATLDLVGLVLLAGGLALMLLGISEAGTGGWSAPGSWLPLAAGSALVAAYVIWSGCRRGSSPACPPQWGSECCE
jgi:hypothetical protein